jgi:hypothetical protein
MIPLKDEPPPMITMEEIVEAVDRARRDPLTITSGQKVSAVQVSAGGTLHVSEVS